MEEGWRTALHFPPTMYQQVRLEGSFNAAQYSFSADEGNNENVKAYILGNPNGGSNCTLYTFDASGNFTSEEITYESLPQVAGGVCVKKYDDATSMQVTKNDDYRAINVLDLSDAYLSAAGNTCLVTIPRRWKR